MKLANYGSRKHICKTSWETHSLREVKGGNKSGENGKIENEIYQFQTESNYRMFRGTIIINTERKKQIRKHTSEK